ncbi:MAG: cupin domain-containing protein [Nocardioides sp.]
MRKLAALICSTALALGFSVGLGSSTPGWTMTQAAGTHQVSKHSHWMPAPPMFPPGAEIKVLQGDPSVAGKIFTVRLRMPKGYVLPAHFHPTDEAVTVIWGAFKVGIGDTYDPHTFLPTLYRGGFVVAPAGVHHFAKAAWRTVVQVNAIGPFSMTYVNPDDDPSRT